MTTHRELGSITTDVVGFAANRGLLRVVLPAVVAAVLFVLAASPSVLLAQAGDKAAKDGPPKSPQVRGLRVLQQSNGLPGREWGQAQQELKIAEDRLWLEDVKSGTAFLYRIDGAEPRIYEISPDRKQYVDGQKLDSIQRDRNVYEKQEIKNSKSMEPEKRDALLRSLHLRPDGKRVVTLSVHEVSEKVLGYKVRRYEVKENDRVIVSAVVTEDLLTQVPFFDFYRKLGAFSEEVLGELAKLPGVPLKATITVVTAGPHYEIQCEVKEIALASFATEEFELPPGAKKLEESPIVACPHCGNDVERKAPGDKFRTRDNVWLYFCSKDHKRKWYVAYRGGKTGDPKSPGGG